MTERPDDPNARPAVARRVALDILSAAELATIHEAALALLGDGADETTRAVGRAPASFLMAGRDPARDLVAGEGNLWLAAGGAALNVVEGDEARPASSSDLDLVCRLSEALPEVSCLVVPPFRQDGDDLVDVIAYCLARSPLHLLVADVTDPAEARRIVAAALEVAGGPDALRARPVLSLLTRPQGLEAALVFARAGLPVGFVLPVEGPPSDDVLEHYLAWRHAGVLAACRAVQDEVPGAAFFYVVPSRFEVSPPAARDYELFLAAGVQLAAHAELPVLVAALGASAGDPGWGACVNNALGTLVVGGASRGAVVTGGGLLASGTLFSPSQLVLDAEVFSWNARIVAGITVDKTTMAADIIGEVGIGGNYLGQRHTRRHSRDVWRPRVLDRSPWDAWVASGGKQAPEHALDFVRRLSTETDPGLSAGDGRESP